MITATECMNGIKRAGQEFSRIQDMALRPFIDRAEAIIARGK